MFTGIIKDLGSIAKLKAVEAGVELHIKSELASKHFTRGNSIAVDGVCLTVESYDLESKVFTATAIPETLKRTNFSQFKEGTALNLETSLTMETPLAGHFVLGHVDTTGVIKQAGAQLIIELPSIYLRFCPEKGSITVNGVSLTLVKVTNSTVEMALIPETLEVTNLGLVREGDLVNIEVDMLARYLDQLISKS